MTLTENDRLFKVTYCQFNGQVSGAEVVRVIGKSCSAHKVNLTPKVHRTVKAHSTESL